MTKSVTRYILDNAQPQAADRFEALASLFDAGTVRYLEALGVGDNWRCLEVAAGGGSIARWMAVRVGPHGRVIATDVDVRHLESLRLHNVDVLRHDILEDPLPVPAFDLVHTRLLLVHLPRREEALDRMIAALKPGGWFLAEEFDSLSTRANPNLNPAETALKSMDALRSVMQAAGLDLGYGRRLPAQLKAHGLVHVDAEGRIPLWQGGSAFSRLQRANVTQLRDPMIASGLVTEDELAADLERLDDPAFMSFAATIWAAWGRKPRNK
jgi:SAM-dependent methyltransferase